MELYALKYAESVYGENHIFRGGDPNKVRPISFTVYLIVTEGRRILVDAGCEDMPGFDMKYFCGPVASLKAMGLTPLDITDVIITHAHYDHIASVHRFQNAVIYIQEKEYEKGKKYIPEGFRVRLFGDGLEVAEGVRAVKIGGHALGSCVVEIEAGGEVYVIAGDECYSMDNLTRQIPTGSTVCPESSDAFLKKYGTGAYRMLLCHNPDVLPGRNGNVRIL